jgi:hypothetical protein
VIELLHIPEILAEDFEAWRTRYRRARAVAGAGRQAAVDEAAAEIERDLMLVGASVRRLICIPICPFPMV